MEQILLQLGVGGIFAILLIREFTNFAHKKKENGSTNNYVEWERQKAMEEILRKLTHAINNQSQILTTMLHNIKETRDEVKEVTEEIKELKRK